MRKNTDEGRKEHPEPQHVEKEERIQKEPEQTKRRIGGYNSHKGLNKGGATTQNCRSSSNPRNRNQPHNSQRKTSRRSRHT